MDNQEFLLFSASEKIRISDTGERSVRMIPSPNSQMKMTGGWGGGGARL